MNSIEIKTTQFIEEKDLIKEGDNILLSLSAGKDSIAMLNILRKYSDEKNFKIGIFHLNHLLRGKDSDRDAEFISEIADSYNIPIYSHSFDFINNPLKGISFEEYAREIRYSLLNNICSEFSYDKIATAHTMSDNAETVFMRIMNGTGVFGLKGISSSRDNIIRPVMCLTKNEIYEYLRMEDLKWREDLSNQENEYLRNFTRNRIFPLINERYPVFEKSLNDLSILAEECTQLIDELIYERYPSLFSKKDSALLININEIINKQKIQNHLISQSLRNHFRMNVTSGMLNEITKNSQAKKANQRLYRNESIEIDRIFHENNSFIRIRKKVAVQELPMWEYELSSNDKPVFIEEIKTSIVVKRVVHNEFQKYKKNDAIFFVTIPNEKFSLSVRNRRQGDRIILDSGSRKIKNLLIEKKLDNESKNWVPLLIIDSKIAAFMPGIILDMSGRVSSEFTVKENSDRIYAVFNPEKFDSALLS